MGSLGLSVGRMLHIVGCTFVAVVVAAAVSVGGVAVPASADTIDPSPTTIISGDATGLVGPVGVSLDGAGNIYVTDDANNSVTVFAADATGNATPTRVISGNATGLVSSGRGLVGWGGQDLM